MIYLPILFICLTGDQCDFVHAKPVLTQAQCEAMNAEYELRLDAVDEVVAYRSACIPVERITDHGPRAFAPGDNNPKFFVGIVRTGLVVRVRYRLVS